MDDGLLGRRVSPGGTSFQIGGDMADASVAILATSGRRETAKRLRAFAGRVIDYAVVTDRAAHNPAPSLRRILLPAEVRSHSAIIDPVQLGGLLRTIDTYPGYPSTIAALRLSPHAAE